MDNLNNDNILICEKINNLTKINQSKDIILPNVLLSCDYKCEKNLSCCELLEQRKALIENRMNISPDIFTKPGELIPDKFNDKLNINHSLDNLLMNNYRILLKSKFRRVSNKMEDFQRAKQNLNNISSVFKYWRYSKNKYIVKIMNFCKFSDIRKSFYKWERLIQHKYFKNDIVNRREKIYSNKSNDINDSLEQYKKKNIKEFHTDFTNKKNNIYQNDNFETFNNNYILKNYIKFNKDEPQKHKELSDGKINNVSEIIGLYKISNIKNIKNESPEKTISTEGNTKLSIININVHNTSIKKFNTDNINIRNENLNNINNKINTINENYNGNNIKNIKPDIASERFDNKKNNEIDLIDNIMCFYNNEFINKIKQDTLNNKIKINNKNNIYNPFQNIENKNNRNKYIKYITKDNIDNKFNKNYCSNKENLIEKNEKFEKKFLKNFIQDVENIKNKHINNKSFENGINDSFNKKFIKLIKKDKNILKKESQHNKNYLNELNNNYNKVIKSITIDNKSDRNHILQKFKKYFNLLENDYFKNNIKQFKNDFKDNNFNSLEKNKNDINELNQNYMKENIKKIKDLDPKNLKLTKITKIKFVDNEKYNKKNHKKFIKDITNNKKEKLSINENMLIPINKTYKIKYNKSFTPDKHNNHNTYYSNTKLNFNIISDNSKKNNFKKFKGDDINKRLKISLTSPKINSVDSHNNIIKKFKIDIPSERIDNKLKRNTFIFFDDNYRKNRIKNLKLDIPDLRNKNYNINNNSINSIEKDYSKKNLKTINFDSLNRKNNIELKDKINLNIINLNFDTENISLFNEDHCDNNIKILYNDNKSFNLISDYFENNKIQQFKKDKSNIKINNLNKFDSFVKEDNSLDIKKEIKENIINNNQTENINKFSEIKEIYEKKNIKTINLNKSNSKLNHFHLNNYDFNLINKEHNSLFNKSFNEDKLSKSFSLPNDILNKNEFNDIQNSYNKGSIKTIRKDYTPQKLKLFNNKKEDLISESGFMLNNNIQDLQIIENYTKNYKQIFNEDKVDKNINNINNLTDDFDNLNNTYNKENIKPFKIDDKNKIEMPILNKTILTNVNDKYLNQNLSVFKIDVPDQKLNSGIKEEDKIYLNLFSNLIKRIKKDLIDNRKKKPFNHSMDIISTNFNSQYNKSFNQDEKTNKNQIIFNTSNINKINSLNISHNIHNFNKDNKDIILNKIEKTNINEIDLLNNTNNIKYFNEDNKDINLNKFEKSNINEIDLINNSDNIKVFKNDHISHNLNQFNKSSFNNVENKLDNNKITKEDINLYQIEKLHNKSLKNFKIDIQNPHMNIFEKSTLSNILNSFYSIKQFKKDNRNPNLNQFEKSKSIIQNSIKQFQNDSSSPRLFITNSNILYDKTENLNRQYVIKNIKKFKEDNENLQLNIINNNNILNAINQSYININCNSLNNNEPNTKLNNYNITNLQISLKEIDEIIKIEEKKTIMKKMSEKLPFKPMVKNSLEEIQKKFFEQCKIKKFKLDKKDNQLKIFEKKNNRLNSFNKLKLINNKFKEYEESKMKIISKKVEKKSKTPPDFAIYLKAIIDKNSYKISPEDKDYLNSIYQEMLLKIYNVDDENNLENVIKGYEEIMNKISIILLSLKMKMDYIPESYFDKYKKYNQNDLSNNDNKKYLENQKNNMIFSSKFKYLFSQYKELGIKLSESSIKFQRKIYITAFLLSFITVIFINLLWNN